MNNIIVDIAYEERDFRKWIIINNKISNMWVVIPCILLFIIGILISGIRNEFTPYSIALLILFSSLLIIFYLIWYVFPMIGYKKRNLENKKSTLVITDDELHYKGELSEMIFKWEIYKKAYETKEMFLLHDDRHQVVILPKRFFRSSEDIELLKTMINNRKNLQLRSIK